MKGDGMTGRTFYYNPLYDFRFLHSKFFSSSWSSGDGVGGFLLLMKANVIVHFENHTFFIYPLEEFCRLSIKKLVTNSKSTQWWCGFSKFTHVRTISKPYFFLHLIYKMIDIRADEFLNQQRNCFLGGAILKYIYIYI